MWRVTFDFTYESRIIPEEYVSGRIGNGHSFHAIQQIAQQPYALCHLDFRQGRKQPVTLSQTQDPITCKRCLDALNRFRTLEWIINWKEE